jgi:hypothetical protein
LLAVSSVAGCRSTSPSPYISPRLEGRVVDAQTHQPISGVKVKRVVPNQNPDVDEAPKGGQLMEKTRAVQSGPDGTFVVDSERDLELFGGLGWVGVTFSFQHAGYATFTTNYTIVNATNTPSGVPLVKAGDILLTPLSK